MQYFIGMLDSYWQKCANKSPVYSPLTLPDNMANESMVCSNGGRRSVSGMVVVEAQVNAVDGVTEAVVEEHVLRPFHPTHKDHLRLRQFEQACPLE